MSSGYAAARSRSSVVRVGDERVAHQAFLARGPGRQCHDLEIDGGGFGVLQERPAAHADIDQKSASLGEVGQRRFFLREARHGSHDVDDRLCGKARHSGGADVFDPAEGRNQPGQGHRFGRVVRGPVRLAGQDRDHAVTRACAHSG